MKLQLLFVVLMLIKVHAADDPKIIFNIQNTNDQSEENIPYKCYKMTGDDLKQCFCCLMPDDKKETFRKFPSEIRRMTLKKLSLLDYMDFLEHCDEEYWGQVIQSLPEEERNKFPKTIKEQQEKLKAIERKVNRLSALTEVGLAALDSTIIGLRPVRMCAEIGYVFCFGSLPSTQSIRSHYFNAFLEKEFGIEPTHW